MDRELFIGGERITSTFDPNASKETEVIIACDVSLRSTGLICMDRNDNIIKIGNIKSDNGNLPSEYGERLLLYNVLEFVKFVYPLVDNYKVTHVVFEGLSLGAKSKLRDLIDGNYWMMRCKIAELFPNINIGSIPVSTWRKMVIYEKGKEKKALRSEYELMHKGNWLKMICVDRLSTTVRLKIDDYIDKYRIRNKLTEKQAFPLIFDLTDAYFLGKYLNMLI